MGLEEAGFEVRWSNDIDPDKQAMYMGHFRRLPGHTFVRRDVGDVKGDDMPDGLTLAWASFPCIDLSLAGWRRGLKGRSSGTFWYFTDVIDQMLIAARRSWYWKTSWAWRPATAART